MAAGTVKWFNEASGYGFIAPDEGRHDLYVRTGSIVGADLATLSAGERVEFESRAAGMGPEAISVRRLAPEPKLSGAQSGG
jgi:CspA family cold shock protein